MAPLVPPSFVDCCFKRRTKPLLPTMVPSLSSVVTAALSRRLLSLSAPAHSRRFPWQTSSPVRYPHSRRFNVTVVVAGSSRRRRDAAGGGTTRDRRRRRRRRRRCRRWGRHRRSFARHRRPRRAGDSPPLTAVESVDCPHRASSSDWPLATRRLARLAAITRSPAIGPVVQRRCTASRRRRRRRRNPRRQPLTAWNRRCPARRRPLCARSRQGRSPEWREGQRNGISWRVLEYELLVCWGPGTELGIHTTKWN